MNWEKRRGFHQRGVVGSYHDSSSPGRKKAQDEEVFRSKSGRCQRVIARIRSFENLRTLPRAE
jgi:hypothetical protein|tara:strand:+ start:332 stop:520 length:189 start_codon:yes stop_codon:yes gene_type:complete